MFNVNIIMDIQRLMMYEKVSDEEINIRKINQYS